MKKPKPLKARGSGSVMASRREPPNSLDFFPTPPWATRALIKYVLDIQPTLLESAWDPACGQGHMAYVLGEVFRRVYASDVFNYGYGEVEDYLDPSSTRDVDWIITNPPFKNALPFTLKSLGIAKTGVAMLCRTSWSESITRYHALFAPHPPAIEAVFVERLAMYRGRWVHRKASGATSYTWFVWLRGYGGQTRRVWIPPGQKLALTRPEDIKRFGHVEPAPLLELVP